MLHERNERRSKYQSNIIMSVTIIVWQSTWTHWEEVSPNLVLMGSSCGSTLG